ncbi:hypothetical protein MHM98_16875 [Psychrobium sp. MM17-31]|uniref:hypothetical protein n=1 Tax=Psychrobium sp. MM17-31 TaxID=2917758 RepID=UPI001EF5AA28|nr:hypothetical protein [Psychrobium sp. MM17-31]MCG7533005.1 hypothetical protein [Psychrobium sp. MM17-31]
MFTIKALILVVLAITAFILYRKGNPKGAIALSGCLIALSAISNSDIHNIPEGIECFIQGVKDGYNEA